MSVGSKIWLPVGQTLLVCGLIIVVFRFGFDSLRISHPVPDSDTSKVVGSSDLFNVGSQIGKEKDNAVTGFDVQQTCRIPDKTDRDVELARVMDGFTGKNVRSDDPELINIIRTHFIDLPRPYVTKFSMPIVKTPQAKEVDSILKSKKRGFFVECGALDGERSSNTNWFEQKAGWNGLLVEMDPSYYMQVRGKNRRSYSINACLSPESYPIKTQFKEHAMGEGRLVTDPDTAEKSPDRIIDTYCFPLYSLMLALNRTKIDYFSLDVEGMELPILKSIPFRKLDIAVLTVEYIHGDSAQEYLDFMASQGYKMVKKLNFVIAKIYLGGNDFVFVRENLL